ncbi:MAG: UDP-N-acetylmuramate--L-alanine ligase [Bacteroidales bacterium]|nr:UDP-N-acetylmuramate--L-alanine ligase [Bacteroidales bacterium]MCI2145567.1 UDP-N-acetylmuramate--L-alanine ligase [Bacteroidales bacterium]
MDNVYLIGIGGIGMSAVARYYKHRGIIVSGYDKTPSKLTAELEEEGIKIHYHSDVSLIPKDREHTLVIYTPAVRKLFVELKYVNENGYTVIKRSRALGTIADRNECLAISGTHGKTTISTLLAHILTDSGEGCSAFLGGISKNYHTNLLLSKNPVLVAEADEFDRSFLQLHPEIAVITATDADHLDIYGNVDNMRNAFAEFASQVKSDGYLIMKRELPVDRSQVTAKTYDYAYDTPCDFYASDIVPQDGGYFEYSINYPGGKAEHCRMGIPGWINVENSVAAFAAAFLHGVEPEKIKKALSCFAGVERRLDIKVNTPSVAYIDDYAHHPNEIAAAIKSIREIFPDRKITGIFQPHLYSRTRDFAKDFGKVLSNLDELILLDIYPARELPIPGVTSKLIFDEVKLRSKVQINRVELMNELKKRKFDVLVTFGAGDIDRFVEPIVQYISDMTKEEEERKKRNG